MTLYPDKKMSKEKHKNKLSIHQKEEIKKLLLDERPIRQEWIAEKFGVRQSLIAYYNRKLKPQQCQL